MPTATIAVTAYNGSLISADLLSGSQTLLLSSLDRPATGTLFDTDNGFGNTDDGVATFDGAAVTYVGSGTATPGDEVLGIFVPLGTAVDVNGAQVWIVWSVHMATNLI